MFFYVFIEVGFGREADVRVVLGHRTFGLSTGQVIPVLVKAETVEGEAPMSTVAPYTTVSTCSAPPATSTA